MDVSILRNIASWNDTCLTGVGAKPFHWKRNHDNFAVPIVYTLTKMIYKFVGKTCEML